MDLASVVRPGYRSMHMHIALDTCVRVNGLVVGSNRAVSRLTRKTKFRGLSRSTACNRKNIWSPHPVWLDSTTPVETIYAISFSKDRSEEISNNNDLRIFSHREKL